MCGNMVHIQSATAENRRGKKKKKKIEDRRRNKSSAVAEMGDRLATIGMGRKWGWATVGGWVPTGSPFNTMWPGPRPTTLPSGIFIHPTVWPQL